MSAWRNLVPHSHNARVLSRKIDWCNHFLIDIASSKGRLPEFGTLRPFLSQGPGTWFTFRLIDRPDEARLQLEACQDCSLGDPSLGYYYYDHWLNSDGLALDEYWYFDYHWSRNFSEFVISILRAILEHSKEASGLPRWVHWQWVSWRCLLG